MNRRKPAEALLIDFDGVLRKYERTESIEARYGLPDGTFLNTGLEWTRYVPAVTGAWTRAQWLDAIADATGAPRHALDEWDAYRGVVDQDVLAFVREIRAAGVPVGLATNATDDLREDLSKLDLDGEFDAVISSAEVGSFKPSREYFVTACAAVGTAKEFCLLLDDTHRNVMGARAAGLLAMRYTGLDDLHYVRSALATG
jgi:putative hydrolase of the HAD superfamily